MCIGGEARLRVAEDVVADHLCKGPLQRMHARVAPVADAVARDAHGVAAVAEGDTTLGVCLVGVGVGLELGLGLESGLGSGSGSGRVGVRVS